MSRLMKYLGWLVLALIGLVIAFIFFGFGYHKSIWYDVVPYRWYDEVVLDVTVDGERMQISATSECRWRHYVTMPDASRTGYKVTGGIVAKRLPSGAALVVRPGAFCHTGGRVKIEGIEGRDGCYYANDIGYFNEGMWQPQPVNHAPLMLWLDDAGNPTKIEAYVSLDYYEHPNARVKLHGFTRQAKRSGSVTDVRDEVPWLAKGNANSFWLDRSVGETWVGYFYWAVPKQAWLQDPLFAPYAQDSDRATFALPRIVSITDHGSINFDDGKIVPVFIEDGTADIRVGGETAVGQVRLTKQAKVSDSPLAMCRGEFTGGGGYLARSAERFSIDGIPITALPEGTAELEYAQWANRIFDPKSELLMRSGAICVTSSMMVRG